jgi:16S rRNA G966 N2-methylase RsmD
VLEQIGSVADQLLASKGLVIVEHDKRKLLPDSINALNRMRILKQGDSVLSFYEGSQASRLQ